MRKYVGPTVATIRVLVQNRRTDGRVVAVVGGETVLSVSSIMKDNLLSEEQSRVRFQPLPGGECPRTGKHRSACTWAHLS